MNEQEYTDWRKDVTNPPMTTIETCRQDIAAEEVKEGTPAALWQQADRDFVEGTSQLEGTPTGLVMPPPLAVNPLHRVLVPIEQGVGPNPSTPLAFLLRTTDGQNYVRDAGTNVIRHLETQQMKGKSGRRLNRQLKAEQRRAEARKIPCQICQGSGISAI